MSNKQISMVKIKGLKVQAFDPHQIFFFDYYFFELSFLSSESFFLSVAESILSSFRSAVESIIFFCLLATESNESFLFSVDSPELLQVDREATIKPAKESFSYP